MKESTIEALLTREIVKRGGMCLKFVSPGTRGAPDRIVVMPHGAYCHKVTAGFNGERIVVTTYPNVRESCKVIFVELKRLAGKLSAGQSLFADELRARGATVQQLYSPEDVGRFLAYLDLNV